MSQINEIKGQNVSVDAGGGNGYFPAGAGLKWVKVYLSYSDLATAATSQNYAIGGQLPDNVVFIQCVARVTQAFDVSNYSIGIDNSILGAANVESISDFATASTFYRSGQGVNAVINANANLDTATTGQIELSFLYAALP